MNKVPYLFISIFLTSSAYTQIIFEKMIPGINENHGYDVIQTNDTGYVVCGGDLDNYYQWPNNYMTLIKTDKNGSVQWFRWYGVSIDNIGYSIQETDDGGLIACGYSQFEGFHAFLVKTGQNGEPIFTRTYQYQEFETFSYSVRQCSDQGFVLCGMVFFNPAPLATLLIRTDMNGDTLWQKIYSSEYPEFGKAVRCVPDSGFTFLSSNDQPSTKLRKVDHSGELEWMKSYSFIKGYAFEKTGEDGFIICGSVLPESTRQIGLLRTNLNGDSLWFKTYPYYAYANSVQVTFDGGYIIGGTIYDSPSAGLRQFFLLRTNHVGDLLWTRKFGGTATDYGNSVKNTIDTGFIFTGTTNKPGTDSTMVYLIKVIDDGTATGNPNKLILQKKPAIYPNPSNGLINIKLNNEAGDVIIEIKNLLGICIFRDFFPQVKDVLSLKVPFQNDGVYLINILTPDFLNTEKVLLIRSE